MQNDQKVTFFKVVDVAKVLCLLAKNDFFHFVWETLFLIVFDAHFAHFYVLGPQNSARQACMKWFLAMPAILS